MGCATENSQYQNRRVVYVFRMHSVRSLYDLKIFRVLKRCSRNFHTSMLSQMNWRKLFRALVWKIKNRWINKMKKWKNEVPEKKKKISFLLFFIFHKRSGEKLTFNTFKISKFIECDHALINSQYLFEYKVLILQGEIWFWSKRVKGYRSFSMHPCTHAPMQPCILSLSFIFGIYLICTWAGQCGL